MPHIYIKNIGPLKEIDIHLNQINIFIGPQSVGKSTLAKLISFCNWLEKDCVLRQEVLHVDLPFIQETLVEYYNLEGYITHRSIFRYQSEIIELIITEGQVSMKKETSFFKASLSKNSYIPSERNVLAIPNILSAKMPANYLSEFIYDWQVIRSQYPPENRIKILNLGTDYYYNPGNQSDMVQLRNGKDIRFFQSSSGLQSVIPLCVYVDYLTTWIYNHEENRSAEKRKLYIEMLTSKFVELAQQKGRKLSYEEMKFLLQPFKTNLVIEEPEQNLFPETQVELVYYILTKIEREKRQDNLIITTHSPYILYALNNCMLASIAAEDSGDIVKQITRVPQKAWVKPSEVSVWEIEEGKIKARKTIQDQRGLIRANYFERVMHNVMADFSNLLSLTTTNDD